MLNIVKAVVGLALIGVGFGQFIKGVLSKMDVEIGAVCTHPNSTIVLGCLLMGLGAIALPDFKERGI
jgi:hypothetical protein